MIYSLTGKITMLTENTVVVDTGTMAFEVICSSYTAYALAGKSEPQTILTYLQVREDAMCLYGFLNRQEKLIFNDLLLVSGVGPKMAVTVLSGLPLEELVRAIANSDLKLLSSIKGLGKKTAERIVLELNTKLGGVGALEELLSNEASLREGKPAMNKQVEEAYEVLISAGVHKTQAVELAKNNYREGMTGEQLVLECFKNMNK